MSEVNRNEFDGLGGRVSKIREDHIKCSAITTGKIATLEQTTKRQEDNIVKIYDRIGDIETEIAKIPGKIESSVNSSSAKIIKTISTVLAIIMIIIQGLSFLAMSLIGK